MFATGSQIWTTPETPTRQYASVFPIPRSEVAEQGAVDLSVPVLRESSHQHISMRVQDSIDTGEGLVPPREIVTVRECHPRGDAPFVN